MQFPKFVEGPDLLSNITFYLNHLHKILHDQVMSFGYCPLIISCDNFLLLEPMVNTHYSGIIHIEYIQSKSAEIIILCHQKVDNLPHVCGCFSQHCIASISTGMLMAHWYVDYTLVC